MAVTEINPKQLTRDTKYDATAGTPTDNNIVATSTTDGWQVNSVTPGDNLLFIFTTDASGTQTVVFKAGAYPPSERKFLGDATYATLGNSKTIVLAVEASRFMTASGTMTVIPADGGMTCLAIKLPRVG